MTKFAYIPKYNTKGQILWEKDGFFKISFLDNTNKIVSEIFLKEEFDFVESLY
jgi:hypothetical protein